MQAMMSSTNINLLGFLSNLEESTVSLLKSFQDRMRPNNAERRQFDAQGRNRTSSLKSKTRIPLQRMRSDPFTEVCSFLEPQALCNLKAVCKFSRDEISKHSRFYWKLHCHRRFKIRDLAGEANFQIKFLSLLMKDLETRRSQLQALSRKLFCIDEYRRQGGQGVIGILSDMVWVDSESVAKAISRKRFMAMATIITSTEGVITKFKRANRNIHGLNSFMPYATAAHSIQDTAHIDFFTRDICIPGLIGYVVNLLRLRPEHEYLRYSVFYIIFKNLMVFDTVSNMVEYTATLTIEEFDDFWGVAVDEYEQETEGVFPRLLTCQNCTYESTIGTFALLTALETELRNVKHSYTVLRYS